MAWILQGNLQRFDIGTMVASLRSFFSQQAEIYDRVDQIEGWYYEAK